MMIIAAIVGGLVILTTVFGLIYHTLDKTLYVEYSESSSVKYRVKLFPNPFYDEEWQEAGQAYVAELTDTVQAEFQYAIEAADPEAQYSYTYSIEAKLIVADRQSKAVIYQPSTVIKAPTTVHATGNATIQETVFIDYADYREKVTTFIESYDLASVDGHIALSLHVETVGNHAAATPNAYDVTLKLPLIERTFRAEMSATVPSGAPQHLLCEAKGAITLFLVLTIVFGVLSVLGAVFLLLFIYLTRNHDINYSIKVKRLVASYKSFIQQITTPFSTEGYRVVSIKTFSEMLEVRDTIGAPLLMYENEDGTATSFVIPSTMGILYTFEIRVEDYNDIYNISEDEASAENSANKSVEESAEKPAEKPKEKPAEKPAEKPKKASASSDNGEIDLFTRIKAFFAGLFTKKIHPRRSTQRPKRPRGEESKSSTKSKQEKGKRKP